MRETLIQSKIRAVLNRRDSPCRVWRNNVGGYYSPEGRWIDYGLCKGSADLIGLERVLITPEMVGSVFARFLPVEVKTHRGRLSDEQKIWHEVVRSFGGDVETMRSEEDAIKFINSRRST